jgi:DNA-binding transcriptional regulator YhcF (GntR family)
MILDVDPSSALPVYEQIRRQITRMAVSGVLPVGSRLPTIRQLASDLGLAKGTVAKAYALLESSAVVESRGHRGTYVIEPDPTLLEGVPGLDQAALSYAVIAQQQGADLTAALAELERQWSLLS